MRGEFANPALATIRPSASWTAASSVMRPVSPASISVAVPPVKACSRLMHGRKGRCATVVQPQSNWRAAPQKSRVVAAAGRFASAGGEVVMTARTSWTVATSVVALAGIAFVGVSADGDPPNTGMADPVALVNAFDRSAGGATTNVAGPFALQSSGSVQRGIERRRDGSAIDLTTGTVTSTVRLLPADATFDLWLIDNRPGARSHHSRRTRGRPDAGRTYAAASGAHTLSVTLGPGGLHRLLPGSRVRRAVGPESRGLIRADGPQHAVRSTPAPAGPFRR